MGIDLENMDSFEIWKYGYRKLPEDFESIEDVDDFYEPIIKVMNERIAFAPSYLKSHVEWERDCLIKHKELLRNLLNPFYIRTPKESKKHKAYFIDPIKSQVRAECEEWVKQLEYKLETGQEYKGEKGKILYLHPKL